MIKRMLKKRVVLATAVLFAVGLLYLIPNDKIYTLKTKEEIEYIDDNNKQVIYMLDSNNMLGRTEVVIKNTDIQAKARELLLTLINNSENESKIPNGFKSIIPSDTKINSLIYKDGLIKVDFSKEIMNVKKQNEEKMVEAIVYTLTTIDKVDKVIIYVEGDILTYLPKTKITLPSTLDKSYGINKTYDILNYKNVNQVTIYYINKNKDNVYYVPVTKYLNDDREKIKIIVDELATSSTYNSNLMSYLNNNTQLLADKQENDTLYLNFNKYIFNDMTDKKILEEVIYTIGLSVEANYNVKEVVFEVDNQEIYKTAIKTIENN